MVISWNISKTYKGRYCREKRKEGDKRVFFLLSKMGMAETGENSLV